MSPPIHPPHQGDLPPSPDELLALGAITAERHREIERHRAKRRLRADAYFSEWESNRELDIAHTRRTHGEDSPSLTAAERTLALARTSRRREEADAARVLARTSISSPAQVPAAARRPRRRGAGRPRGATRSNARSGDSGDDPGGESSDDDDAWPGGFSFRAYDELISTTLPGYVRARLFYALPERWQREAWDRESAALDRWARR